MNELVLSEHIENILVAQDLRGMKQAQAFLSPGYYLRAAQLLFNNHSHVLIGTGFPVSDTFETDGPVGAIALYEALQTLGGKPVLVCGDPLYSALKQDYDCLALPIGNVDDAPAQAQQTLNHHQPSLVLSIERPGLTSDGSYRNMRGEDISARCARFDDHLDLALCPTIAIGDGGNEIGMGNIAEHLSELDITTSATKCDELLIADVSNWAAYGLIAFLSLWSKQDLLAQISPISILQYLSDKGSVDGVTRENTLTEDSLCVSAGEAVIKQIRDLIFSKEL